MGVECVDGNVRTRRCEGLLVLLPNRGKYIAIYKKIIELLIREITRNRSTLEYVRVFQT